MDLKEKRRANYPAVARDYRANTGFARQGAPPLWNPHE
jgi:hypothetical protein